MLGADFRSSRTVNDARRRGGTPGPGPRRVGTVRAPALRLSMHVPVDPKGGSAMNDVKRSQRRPVGQGGFTLIELIIVVAVISIVAACAVPLHANEEARARVAKVQAEIRTLACAVNLYAAHMGTLPFALTALTTAAVNGRNESAGPFVTSIPPRRGEGRRPGAHTRVRRAPWGPSRSPPRATARQ